MAKFRIDQLDELCRQMAFTPQEARSAQLDAAEALLLVLDPGRTYPFDFIVFRITGYHRRHGEQTLLGGLALQHDLGLLIEQLSQTLKLHSDKIPGGVVTIDEVSERFNVTSKTIQRWRRRGLAARRFIFPDGKKRVGFLPSTVERFATHRDQVAAAANFSQVGSEEKAQILRRARRLAEHGRCCAAEIARRIGVRLDRSPMTILHVVRTHDAENPAGAIFPLAGRDIDSEQRDQIVRGYRRGVPVSELASRLRLTRWAVYRAVMEDRLNRLQRRKVKFIDDPLYHQAAASQVIDELVRSDELASPPSKEQTRIPRDLPPYLRDLYRTPLLSASRERALFLKLNFHKFEFVSARRQLDARRLRARDLEMMEKLHRRITEAKNAIVRANLRLVVSVARKHLRGGLSLMELISDGNLTLLRAVESFDAHRGFRFSTYATLALMKGFARSVPRMSQRPAGAGRMNQASLEALPEREPGRDADHLLQRDEVRQLLSRLEPRERDVIRAHYGLLEGRPATLEQVGARMGLSKQRVRQIEQVAMAKMRDHGKSPP